MPKGTRTVNLIHFTYGREHGPGEDAYLKMDLNEFPTYLKMDHYNVGRIPHLFFHFLEPVRDHLKNTGFAEYIFHKHTQILDSGRPSRTDRLTGDDASARLEMMPVLDWLKN